MRRIFSTEEIVTGVKRGDKRFASILMTMVEDGVEEGRVCIKALAPFSQTPHTIGVTGWPGAGKSTIISKIARKYLDMGRKIGIIAIDPTSPISGGSFLGDRERMREIDGNEGVFIRSMATRGHSGGIARATDAFIKIMGAMGKDTIIVETVGVGQDQVSIRHLADTLLMVVMPGMGDYLQALKAGILELGDIFVVNKADRPGAEEMVMDLEMLFSMACREDGWRPRIVKTVATERKGVEELIVVIDEHREFLTKNGLLPLKKMEHIKIEIKEALKGRLLDIIDKRMDLKGRLDAYAKEIGDGKQDMEGVIDDILKGAGFDSPNRKG
ncbi:MAG: methylmalonyl Co-A mutase-associated GTPase MeaB [Syntrophorhabdaceae bacterium]|nr:methylmalonyl Co-A mutase-associated GTPase MeaB [Syntrophorhabdaceae bacterium]